MFYLNVAEQLMKPLKSEYVEGAVLRTCHPCVVLSFLSTKLTLSPRRYLEDPTHRDTFESAHSVLLAIFASEKGCANELAPWYTKLLLRVRTFIFASLSLC